MDSSDGFLKIDDFTVTNLMVPWANEVNSGMYLRKNPATSAGLMIGPRFFLLLR